MLIAAAHQYACAVSVQTHAAAAQSSGSQLLTQPRKVLWSWCGRELERGLFQSSPSSCDEEDRKRPSLATSCPHMLHARLRPQHRRTGTDDLVVCGVSAYIQRYSNTRFSKTLPSGPPHHSVSDSPSPEAKLKPERAENGTDATSRRQRLACAPLRIQSRRHRRYRFSSSPRRVGIRTAPSPLPLHSHSYTTCSRCSIAGGVTYSALRSSIKLLSSPSLIPRFSHAARSAPSSLVGHAGTPVPEMSG